MAKKKIGLFTYVSWEWVHSRYPAVSPEEWKHIHGDEKTTTLGQAVMLMENRDNALQRTRSL